MRFSDSISIDTRSKSRAQWFLAVDTAILQIFSEVFHYRLKKIISSAYITKLMVKPFHLVH